MKIERIDDKTVKCFLSNEELEEYDIDYKDFVTRSDKAKEVVQEIIEQAEEEVGYKPPKYAFDLQIMMLPDEGLVLVLSEKEPLENKSGAQLLQALQEMKRVFEEKKAEIGAAEKKAQVILRVWRKHYIIWVKKQLLQEIGIRSLGQTESSCQAWELLEMPWRS